MDCYDEDFVTPPDQTVRPSGRHHHRHQQQQNEATTYVDEHTFRFADEPALPPPPPVQSSLQVALRVRPLSTKEGSNPEVRNIIKSFDSSVVVDANTSAHHGARRMMAKTAVPRAQQFNGFASVFGPRSSQEDVFDASVRPILTAAFDGINGAVLAYGATGSGKTHTMLGSELSSAGVIPQSMAVVFARKRELEHIGKAVDIRISFYEVYNEQLFDLLAPRPTRQELQQMQALAAASGNKAPKCTGPVALAIRDKELDNGTMACEVPNLMRRIPEDIDEFHKILDLGIRNRIAEETFANEKSSRSHAILNVEIEVRENSEAQDGYCSSVKFCDLAGSERAAGTQNVGLRLREGANINKSLLALGAVVNALAKNSTRRTPVFVPYRGSKLTRLLRDCLGGNCNALMLVCISPSSKSVEETLNTLNYAMQAKRIESNAKKNQFKLGSGALAENYENVLAKKDEEIARLKEELRMVLANRSGSNAPRESYRRSEPPRPVMKDKSTDCHGLCCTTPMTPTRGSGKGFGALSPPSYANASQQHSQQIAADELLFSPTSSSAAMAQQLRSSTALMYERNFNLLAERKESLFEDMKGVSERRDTEIERSIRESNITIVNYLSQRVAEHKSLDLSPAMIPVGVAYAIEQINSQKKLQDANMRRQEEIQEDMDANNDALILLHKKVSNDTELPERDRQELMMRFDLLKTRMNGLEAEDMAAAFFHGRLLEEQQRTEYAMAVENLVALVKKFERILPANGRPEAARALALANVPGAKTADMIDAFKAMIPDSYDDEVSPSRDPLLSDDVNTPPPVTPLPIPHLPTRLSVRMELNEPQRSVRRPLSARRHAPAPVVRDSDPPPHSTKTSGGSNGSQQPPVNMNFMKPTKSVGFRNMERQQEHQAMLLQQQQMREQQHSAPNFKDPNRFGITPTATSSKKPQLRNDRPPTGSSSGSRMNNSNRLRSMQQPHGHHHRSTTPVQQPQQAAYARTATSPNVPLAHNPKTFRSPKQHYHSNCSPTRSPIDRGANPSGGLFANAFAFQRTLTHLVTGKHGKENTNGSKP